jgi:hypothetical protein
MKSAFLSQFYRFYLLVLFLAMIPVVQSRIHGNPRSVIWSDCEGYYVYLPAVFNLHDVHAIQPGSMWPIKNEKGEMVVKYTCGVAYFELPFFLAAKVFCMTHGVAEDDIYSRHYARAVALAGLSAAFLGLFFLQRTLRRKGIREPVILLTLLAVFGGTNLFHYATKELGMSHAYSFCLFAFLVWQIPRALTNPSWKNALLLGGVLGWILLIRPTNGLLAMIFVLLYDVYDWNGLKARFGFFRRHLPKVGGAAVMGIVMCLPQMWYWHEMTGHWLRYSYENESFIYWNKPKILAVLFDPQNGLFLYSPIFLLAIIGIFFDWRKKQNQSLALSVIFVLATYLFASWWAWWFGGAFGHRCYVELYPMFVFPLAAMTGRMLDIRQPLWRYASIGLFAFLIYYSVRLSFLYNILPGPWDGADWRWNWEKIEWIWGYLFKHG